MKMIQRLLTLSRTTTSYFSSQTTLTKLPSSFRTSSPPLKPLLNPSPYPSSPLFPSSFFSSYPNPNFSQLSGPCLRFFSTSLTDAETDKDLDSDGWEDQDDTDPEIGDGGYGGGIVVQNVPWGEKVLSIAQEVLLQFGDDIKLYAFKTTPRGYIYVRLDKLSNEYGCPGDEELENYNRLYKERLDEEETKGHLPDLGVEVSSPGADRLLRVPEDLHRFKDFPMLVSYVEGDTEANSLDKTGVFYLDSVETESEQCVWKLADVKENRDPARKGRPLNRKQRDWRLKVPYSMVKKVRLYL